MPVTLREPCRHGIHTNVKANKQAENREMNNLEKSCRSRGREG